jgi:hypothetical protein
LEVVPLIFIIVTNCLIMKTLKKKIHENKNSDLIISNQSFAISNYNRTTIAIKRLAYFLIFSLTPYLMYRSFVLLGFFTCGFSSCDFGKTKVITLENLYYPVVDVP